MDDAGERMERAGRYVRGLMDEQERELAERDLEVDAAFRDATVEATERMHVFGHRLPLKKTPHDPWLLIKERIDALPQMLGRGPRRSTTDEDRRRAVSGRPVTFGRRKTDNPITSALPETVTPTAVTTTGGQVLPGHRVAMFALALIFAFTFGYLVGANSIGAPQSATVFTVPD